MLMSLGPVQKHTQSKSHRCGRYAPVGMREHFVPVACKGGYQHMKHAGLYTLASFAWTETPVAARLED